MKRKKIGIIGIKGRFGRWFERFFAKRRFEILGTDIGTKVTLEKLVRWADVVIVCVPIPEAAYVIGRGLRFSNPNQLWIDITTVKEPSTDELRSSNVEFVTLHPLFAPPESLSWKGESAATGYSRIDLWNEWWSGFLRALKVKVVSVETRTHDFHMLGDQNLPHAGAIGQVWACERLGLDPKLLLALATKVSRKQFAIAARILSQNPELYADIQLGNSSSYQALTALIDSLIEFRAMVVSGNKKKIVSTMRSLRAYLGDDFIQEALKSFK
jgi:prephenate dehydrogenase